MTDRDNLIAAFSSTTTPHTQKPHILRQINKIDDKNDQKLEAIQAIIDDPAVILSCRGNYVYDQVKAVLDR